MKHLSYMLLLPCLPRNGYLDLRRKETLTMRAQTNRVE